MIDNFLLKRLTPVLAALWLAACSTPDNSEPPAPLTEIDNAQRVDNLWSVSTGEGVDLNFFKIQPLVIGDKVYTIGTEGLIQRIDAKEGDVEWEFESGLKSVAGLAGRDNSLIASSIEGELVRFDLEAEGPARVWSTPVSSEIRSPAILSGNQVLLRSADGKLSALDFNDGRLLWSVSRRVPPLSLTGNSHPVVSGDLVISGFDNGKLVALERATGSTVWETSVGVPAGRSEIERLVDLDGQFVVRDGVVYVASFQGNLAAIVVSSGQVLWSRKFSSYQAMDVDGEALYLTDDKSHVWSVDRRTGSAFWKQDILNARKLTGPRLLGDKLVVADLEGYVHFLDKQDGSLLARAETYSERYLSHPVIVNDSALVLDAAGRLTALSQPRSK